MRLTNQIRSKFVNAVMKAAPASVAAAKAHARCLAAAHRALREHDIDPDVFEKIVALGFAYRNINYISGLGHLPCPEAHMPQVEDLVHLSVNERESQKNVREQLMALAMSCTTLKQLREAAPELAKYMPTNESGVDRTVPVVQVNIAEVLKAAGWAQ